MKGNLIITVGISNSGKSTWAREQVKTDPLNVLLVNRDKIRELIFGYTEENISEYYLQGGLGKFEKEVTKYEDTLIYEGLEAGKTVIVDATHLEIKYLERFRYWNVPTELKLFHIGLDEAIKRDVQRMRSVGADVIKKQLQKFRNLTINALDAIDFTPVEFVNDPDLPPCYIFDVDNTLAIRGDRSPFDWKRVGEDLLDKSTSSLAFDLFKSGAVGTKAKIIVCTGRDGVCLKETKDWLKKHSIYYDEIYIREEGSILPDWQIKEALWRDIAKRNYITMLVDDRNSVCRRARALGLKVAQVEYGNF